MLCVYYQIVWFVLLWRIATTSPIQHTHSYYIVLHVCMMPRYDDANGKINIYNSSIHTRLCTLHIICLSPSLSRAFSLSVSQTHTHALSLAFSLSLGIWLRCQICINAHQQNIRKRLISEITNQFTDSSICPFLLVYGFTLTTNRKQQFIYLLYGKLQALGRSYDLFKIK